jgi:hypothetical protein
MGSVVTPHHVTVYRVRGRGKAWLMKGAAYRSAAIARVNEACGKTHEFGLVERGDGWHESVKCRYCNRSCTCAVKRLPWPDEDCPMCGEGSHHSYRYRLVGRLARWWRWLDSREATS